MGRVKLVTSIKYKVFSILLVLLSFSCTNSAKFHFNKSEVLGIGSPSYVIG